MTGILDHFYNSFVPIILFCILLGVAFYFSGKPFLKKPAGKEDEGKIPAWFQTVSLCIGIVGPIVLAVTNELVCGFGFSDALTPVGRRGDVMLLQAVVETEDSSSYRLYGVNLETGKKLFRRYYRDTRLEGKLEAWNGGLLWFNLSKGVVHPRSREIIAVSAATGETAYELEPGTLRRKSGLKAEIGKIEAFTGDNTVIVQTKDGLWTEIDPVKFTVVREQDVPIIPIHPAADFRIKKADCTSSIRVRDKVWRLEGSTRKRLQFDEPGDDRVPGAPGMSFINGCFISAFLDRELVPVMSWEDTDSKHFLLHAFSADGKMLWRLEGRELAGRGIPAGTPNMIARHRDSLVLLRGGYVVSISIDSGKINWHLRL